MGSALHPVSWKTPSGGDGRAGGGGVSQLPGGFREGGARDAESGVQCPSVSLPSCAGPAVGRSVGHGQGKETAKAPRGVDT